MIVSLCLAILACAATTHAAATTCNHESCNPAYEPFPNLHAAMVGYHIMQGNPFDQSSLYDPGFKTSFIFLPMIKNAQNKYELHAGVTATGRSSCQLSISNDVVTTVKGYQTKVTEKETQGLDFASNNEVELEVGAKGVSVKGKIPPIVTAKFSASKAFGENEKFFTKDKGVLTMSDAACPAYTLHQSRFNPPPFSPQFVNGLKYLEKYIGGTDADQDTAFGYFVQEFGTHYVQFAVMGARIAITSRYTEKEYSEQGNSAIEKCNSHKIGVSVGFSATASQATCKDTTGANSKYLNNGMNRYYVSSYGSKPKKDLHEWANQQFDEPVPIKMQLSPITNLFQDTHMSAARLGVTVDYKGILKFFGKRYWNYCENNKARYGVNSCDPSSEKGCGWNDDCVRGRQTCINDPYKAKGYFCCSDPCKNSNCGQGKCVGNMNTCKYTCTCNAGYGGSNCQDRYIVKATFETELKDQMRIGNGRTNDQFRDDVFNWIRKTYPDYRFAVNVIKDNANWAWTGYGVGIKNLYGKSLIVFYQHNYYKPNSNHYTIASSALNMVTNKGCDAAPRKDAAWNYISANGGLDALYVQHGSELRSRHTGEGFHFDNHKCGSSCNIWGSNCSDLKASLVTFF